jgi:hypothetical protein
MDLPDDVVRYVERSFSRIEREEALEVLRAVTLAGCPEKPARMLRCAVISANRDLGRLRRQIAQLAFDYRDVIVEGEYAVRDGKLIRVRDLTSPIRDDE